MGVHSMEDLVEHYGHATEVVTYGTPPVNAAIECLDCDEVLVDFDKRFENVRVVEFRIDTGDPDVGVMGWRFHTHSLNPTENLQAALKAWDKGDHSGVLSMVQALDECPDRVLVTYDLVRVVPTPLDDLIELPDSEIEDFLEDE